MEEVLGFLIIFFVAAISGAWMDRYARKVGVAKGRRLAIWISIITIIVLIGLFFMEWKLS